MAFNEADHPRNPKDSPNGTGGKFTVKTSSGDDSDLDGGTVTPFGKASLATDVVEMLDDQKYYGGRQDEVSTWRCDNGDLLLYGDNATILVHPQRHEDGSVSCTCSTLGRMSAEEVADIADGDRPAPPATDEYHTPSVHITRSGRGQLQVDGRQDPMRLKWAVNRAAESWRDYDDACDPVTYKAFEDVDGAFYVYDLTAGFDEFTEPNEYTEAPFEDRERLRADYVERMSDIIRDEYGLDVKDRLGDQFDARYERLLNDLREDAQYRFDNGDYGRSAAEWLSRRADPGLKRIGGEWLAAHADA